MATPDLDTVHSTLKPLESVLVGALQRAWRDWRSAELTHWRRRGRANYVWEQAVHYAVLDVRYNPEVRVVVKNESYHFLVGDVVSFRLKKADGAGYTRNYPTQEALAFHDPQLPLSGIPAEQRVEVTYCLNEPETDINDIQVVARVEDSVAWSYSIFGRDSVASLSTTQATERPKANNTMVSTGLVRPKGQQKIGPDSAGDSGEP